MIVTDEILPSEKLFKVLMVRLILKVSSSLYFASSWLQQLLLPDVEIFTLCLSRVFWVLCETLYSNFLPTNKFTYEKKNMEIFFDLHYHLLDKIAGSSLWKESYMKLRD